MPFSWGLWDKGFNWDGLRRLLPGNQRPTKHCARQNGTYAPSPRSWLQNRGVWKEIASGAKQERAERKKVLALAQAPQGRHDPRHRN